MNELGNIKIADDVVKTITAKATLDVPGVYKLSGGVADEVSKMLGKKRPTNGVKVEVGERECSVEVYVIVEYGYLISDVAQKIQQSVLNAITTMTGLKVVEINVFVQDIRIVAEESDTKIEESEKI